MKKELIIKEVRDTLENITSLKEELINRDPEEKLSWRLRKLKIIIGNLNKLSYCNQQLIAYRYFENLSFKRIGIKLNIDVKTVKRRLEQSILEVGRFTFGLEDELLDELGFNEEDDEKMSREEILFDILG
ncbi:hypothetical protein [Clostridium sp.]|uniref:hypothetical protein n=1 Tax=Clostridium sp. TaxID=1506 RepID=UPI00290C5DCA|nr:hypothetical protein [Clostridium sp.]MDU4724842.1 hypothetical protein [Clostridium sp.]